MFTKFALKPVLVLFVIMLLSTLVVGSAVTAKDSALTSGAIPAVLPVPIPGGPGFISVSTFGFEPYDPTMTMIYDNTWIHNGSQIPGAYFAPVYLPHGANLTKVVFFYYDISASANMVFYLERVSLFNGARSEVARAYPTGSAGNSTIECEIFVPLIDNQLYSYILEVDIPGGYGSALSLINVRIDYGYPSYLPAVNK